MILDERMRKRDILRGYIDEKIATCGIDRNDVKEVIIVIKRE